MAVGAVLQAVGAVASAAIGFAGASYQAQVAKINSQIAKDNANRAVQTAQYQALDQDRLNAAALGEQLSEQGASGLSLTSKSFTRSRKAVRELGRRDTLNVKQSGDIEAYNYRIDAMNSKAQGKLAKIAGVGELVGGFLNAGSLISNAMPTNFNRRFSPRPLSKPMVMV